MEERKAVELGVANLAFVGDAIYELLVREKLARKQASTSGVLHKATEAKVCAKAQAIAYDFIQSKLTAVEKNTMKRGRNANTTASNRNIKPIAYKKATGLEVLFGYLFLSGNHARLNEVFLIIFEFLDTEKT
ncbi:MAG: ribonuclease III [Oscillospiraceae bacterium]|nr:ribonuclease III [Oscillospiraceae bacterium]